MNEQIITQLEDFLELVLELEATPYWQSACSNRIAVSGREGSMQLVDFNEHDFRAFLLTFRMLIQDNESTSIRKVYEVIKKSKSDTELFAKVNGYRWMLNDFLDRQKWKVPDGAELSFREIKSTFLYGEYAHRNRTYRARLTRWKENNDQYAVLKMNFTLAIRVIVIKAIEIAEAIRNPNKIIKREPPLAVDGFSESLKDRNSIRLVVAGVIKNESAFNSLKRRQQLSRMIHIFLCELGRNEGRTFSSLNTKSQNMNYPEGVLLGGDASYRGACTTVNGVELDPDRTIQFAIGFLDDWRIIVSISSSELPADFISLGNDEPFDRVFQTIEMHHSKIFDGWPLSEIKLKEKTKSLISMHSEQSDHHK